MKHIEATRVGMESNRKKGTADRFSLAEKRIQNLENYNHNLANQILSLLSSINKNITSLMRWVKDRGGEEEETTKDREKAKSMNDNSLPDQD